MTDNVDDFLAHYGVKGMKWGQRRAARIEEIKSNSAKAKQAGYSNRQRNADVTNIGYGGVRRVEKRLANGETIKKARTKEYVSSTARGMAVGLAIAGTYAAVTIGPSVANRAAGNLAANINAKRGAEAARKLFADNKGLTSYSTVALAFDKATGTFR